METKVESQKERIAREVAENVEQWDYDRRKVVVVNNIIGITRGLFKIACVVVLLIILSLIL